MAVSSDLYKTPLRDGKKYARMVALESIDIGSTIRLEADAPLSGIKTSDYWKIPCTAYHAR